MHYEIDLPIASDTIPTDKQWCLDCSTQLYWARCGYHRKREINLETGKKLKYWSLYCPTQNKQNWFLSLFHTKYHTGDY